MATVPAYRQKKSFSFTKILYKPNETNAKIEYIQK